MKPIFDWIGKNEMKWKDIAMVNLRQTKSINKLATYPPVDVWSFVDSNWRAASSVRLTSKT